MMMIIIIIYIPTLLAGAVSTVVAARV
jgi:hypothetical protein